MNIYPVYPAYRVIVFSRAEEPVYDIYCSSYEEASNLYNKFSERMWKACAIWCSRLNRYIMKVGQIPDAFVA